MQLLKKAAASETQGSTKASSSIKRNEVAEHKASSLKFLKKVLPSWFFDKTEVCKHDHGCFENVISEALQNFIFGFGFQHLLKMLPALTNPGKLLKIL
jgi:hypothetical protein